MTVTQKGDEAHKKHTKLKKKYIIAKIIHMHNSFIEEIIEA
jgi:hypothetical protein